MTCARLLLAVGIWATTVGFASAKELEVIGRASVPITSDAGAVRANAVAQARQAAVTAAVEKVLGPGSSRDPRVGTKLNAVFAQVREEAYVDTKSSAAAGSYQAIVTLVLDDKEFRTLLSDLGIAVNTATVRSSSILAIMDEFLASARELNVPLEELVEYRREAGQSYIDNSRAAEASASSESARVRGDQALAANRGDASLSGSSRLRASASSETSSSSVSVTAVSSEQHDDVSYRKLVKYQPQGGTPEKANQTYNALTGQLQDYDLRLLDNDQFRSKYFKDRPLTLDELQHSEALSQYVAFAKSEASADFFMIGTSIIIDAGKNPNTGDSECTGILSIKTYSTVDGESIASETISEASSGRNLNDCGANLAKKLASVGGPVIGARVHDYWKRRSTYGREIVLTLKGGSLPLMVRSSFSRALKGLRGVESDVQRACGDKSCQIVVTYKGSEPIDQALASALATNPTFATLDSRTEGTNVLLCMGPCSSFDAAAPSPVGTP